MKGVTRKNNPPAKIAAEGIVPAVPKTKYSYSPRLAPVLRFDKTGAADKLSELLELLEEANPSLSLRTLISCKNRML